MLFFHFLKICVPTMFLLQAHRNKLNPLDTNPIKWSNTLKQFVGKLLTNCLSVFDHFVGLALKRLIKFMFHFFFCVSTGNYFASCYLKTRWPGPLTFRIDSVTLSSFFQERLSKIELKKKILLGSSHFAELILGINPF